MHKAQRCIQNPVKHQIWCILRKKLTAERYQLFSQKDPPFDWVLKITPMYQQPTNIELVHNRILHKRRPLRPLSRSNHAINLLEIIRGVFITLSNI